MLVAVFMYFMEEILYPQFKIMPENFLNSAFPTDTNKCNVKEPKRTLTNIHSLTLALILTNERMNE